MRETATFDRKFTGASTQRGNAMVYILVALALVGFLTMTLTRQSNQADEQDISEEQAELYALELMEYAATAEQVIEMMLATGSEIDDLDFVNPSSSNFNTGSHIYKVFHPQGGGLNYTSSLDSKMLIDELNGNWRFKNNNNVEWTPTAASDIILSNQYLKASICEQYNKKINGSTNIPELPSTLNKRFSQSFSNDFTIADCPECEGYPTLCVKSGNGSSTGIYYIIAGR